MINKHPNSLVGTASARMRLQLAAKQDWVSHATIVRGWINHGSKTAFETLLRSLLHFFPHLHVTFLCYSEDEMVLV